MSFGGLIKSEYKYEKDHLKIKSSEITADNMILDAKMINIEASKLKADSMEISTDILNMISSKESLYENEFSIRGGVLTATIENQGEIKEVVVPSTIEVNSRLIFNKQDITNKLETNNLVKTLSSQGNLTNEQINLIKEIANSEQWHDKTTTLSGMGALAVQVVVTYFTAGVGSGITAGISNAALQSATQATIQSLVTQTTAQLATAAITGNSFKLDPDSMIKNAVTAGVLNYATTLANSQGLLKNALENDMDISDYLKNATVQGVFEGVRSEVRGGEFIDGFTTGAIISVASDSALQMRKYQEENYDYPGKNDDSAVKLNRTNLSGDKSILGDNELAGAFPKIKITDGKPEIIPGSGLTGGDVFGDRTLFGVKVDKTGFFGYTLENFAGPHDFMSSWNYQNIGGKTSLINDGLLTEIGSGLLLIPAAPFAAGTFMQDNLNFIHEYKNIRDENRDLKNEAIDSAKDRR